MHRLTELQSKREGAKRNSQVGKNNSMEWAVNDMIIDLTRVVQMHKKP